MTDSFKWVQHLPHESIAVENNSPMECGEWESVFIFPVRCNFKHHYYGGVSGLVKKIYYVLPDSRRVVSGGAAAVTTVQHKCTLGRS